MTWKRVAVAVLLAAAAGCGKKDPSAAGSTGGGSASGSTAAGATPQATWEATRTAVMASDAKALWGLISEKSRRQLMDGEKLNAEVVQRLEGEALESEAKERGVTAEALRKASLEEYCIMTFGTRLKDEAERKRQEGAKWKEAKVDGEKAVAAFVNGDGREERLAMVREGGVWRVDLEETAKMEEGKE